MPEERGFLLSTIVDDGRVRQLYALRANTLINCAGLDAQHLATMVIEEYTSAADDQNLSEIFGVPEQVLSKGSYFDYTGANPFSHLIYPRSGAKTLIIPWIRRKRHCSPSRCSSIFLRSIRLN